jgi:hypothetical protein
MKDMNHEMITGSRVHNEVLSNSRNLRNVLHRIGNSFFTKITNLLLDSKSKDVLSGWRLMTWNFAKTFPSVHDGFEVELELNSHARKLGVSTADIAIEYGVRPADSFSKLRTGSDGWKILKSVLKSFTNDRPRIAFDLLSAPWLLVSAYLLFRVLSSYFETGELKLPSLVFFTATFLMAIQLWTIGRILDRIALNQKSNLRIKFREG